MQNFLKGMKCPRCGEGFDEDSFNIMRNEDGLLVLQVKCEKCEKGFGMALFGLSEDEIKSSFARKHSAGCGEEAAAISFDDIIEAHKCIQNLDENWKAFMESRAKG